MSHRKAFLVNPVCGLETSRVITKMRRILTVKEKQKKNSDGIDLKLRDGHGYSAETITCSCKARGRDVNERDQ